MNPSLSRNLVLGPRFIPSQAETAPRTLPRDLPPLAPRQAPTIAPIPSPEWAPTVDLLTNLARYPATAPSWWKMHAQFRASIQTGTESTPHALDDGSDPGPDEDASLSFHLVLAGTGYVRLSDQDGQLVGAGTGFFARAGSAPLAVGSAGFTVLHIDVFHPYLKTRLAQQAAASGPLLHLDPNEALTSTAIRLARGELRKDFRDRFDAEMALFDFVVAFDRWAQPPTDGAREAQRLIEDVRSHVLARLPAAIEVLSLAELYGMSRSHFSQFFRKVTGLTPAHFATEVRIERVEQLLLDTREPLKSIAAACGFANANHLCKVFRRFRHVTPKAFRRSFGRSIAGHGIEGATARAVATRDRPRTITRSPTSVPARFPFAGRAAEGLETGSR